MLESFVIQGAIYLLSAFCQGSQIHAQTFCGLLKLFDMMFCNAHCVSAALLCALMVTECIYKRTHTLLLYL